MRGFSKIGIPSRNAIDLPETAGTRSPGTMTPTRFSGSAAETVEDRVVQTAMKLVLEPIFEADFIRVFSRLIVSPILNANASLCGRWNSARLPGETGGITDLATLQ